MVLVKNLRKEFPRDSPKPCSCAAPASERLKTVVCNSSFAVEAGEVFGLLGPNGAGKTTTLNMIIADVGPTRGKVGAALQRGGTTCT